MSTKHDPVVVVKPYDRAVPVWSLQAEHAKLGTFSIAHEKIEVSEESKCKEPQILNFAGKCVEMEFMLDTMTSGEQGMAFIWKFAMRAQLIHDVLNKIQPGEGMSVVPKWGFWKTLLNFVMQKIMMAKDAQTRVEKDFAEHVQDYVHYSGGPYDKSSLSPTIVTLALIQMRREDPKGELFTAIEKFEPSAKEVQKMLSLSAETGEITSANVSPCDLFNSLRSLERMKDVARRVKGHVANTEPETDSGKKLVKEAKEEGTRLDDMARGLFGGVDEKAVKALPCATGPAPVFSFDNRPDAVPPAENAQIVAAMRATAENDPPSSSEPVGVGAMPVAAGPPVSGNDRRNFGEEIFEPAQVNLPESGDDPRTLVKVSFVEPAQANSGLGADARGRVSPARAQKPAKHASPSPYGGRAAKKTQTPKKAQRGGQADTEGAAAPGQSLVVQPAKPMPKPAPILFNQLVAPQEELRTAAVAMQGGYSATVTAAQQSLRAHAPAFETPYSFCIFHTQPVPAVTFAMPYGFQPPM